MMLAGAGYLAEQASAKETGKAIRVAVVGTGARGSDLIRKLNTIQRARIVAVCDNYPPHLEQGQKYAKGAKAFADYAKMLRHIAADAVVVATPLHTHFPMCMKAIGAGRAVFCEKDDVLFNRPGERTRCRRTKNRDGISGRTAAARQRNLPPGGCNGRHRHARTHHGHQMSMASQQQLAPPSAREAG